MISIKNRLALELRIISKSFLGLNNYWLHFEPMVTIFVLWFLSTNVISSMDYSYRTRFLDYVQVKEDFYFGEHALFSDEDLNKMRISGEFSPDKDYQDGQHKGIDFASKLDAVGNRLYDLTGTDILSFYSGRVVKNYQSESAGNSKPKSRIRNY